MHRVFLLASAIFLQATFVAGQDLDSLLNEVRNMECGTINSYEKQTRDVINSNVSSDLKARAYLIIGLIGLCESDYEKARASLNQSIRLFEEADLLDQNPEPLFSLIKVYMQQSQLDSSLIIANKIRKMALARSDSSLLSRAYGSIAGTYLYRSMNDSAIYFSRLQLKIAEQLEDQPAVNRANMIIAGGFYGNEEFEKALDYFLAAKKGYEKIGEDGNLGRLYYNLAITYSALDSMEKSLDFFNRTIKSPGWLANKYLTAYAYQGMAVAHQFLKQYDSAIAYNLRSKELSEEIGESRNLSTVLANLSGCYYETGQYRKAIKTASGAVEVASSVGFGEKEADGYYYLALASGQIGDHETAFNAFRKFYSLDSVIINEKRNQAIAELEARYETEKKDNEIKALTHQSDVQELKLRQRNIMLAGAGILLIFLAAGGYLFYHQKKIRQQQAISEMEQRMLRLQMNPHFIFNALGSIQNYILQNDTRESVKYLSKFAKLMRQILEHSRQEFISLEEEINMLRNYIEIQQLRFQGQFDFSIETVGFEDVVNTKIPPLFAQPFVENAIEHGLKDIKEGGMIYVRFKASGKNVLLEIEDNGTGIKETVREHKSLATQITKERLEIFNNKFNHTYELTLSKGSTDKGTKAQITLPCAA